MYAIGIYANFCPARAHAEQGSFDDDTGMGWIVEYFRNVLTEMEKVNWPTTEELTNSTLVTLVATIIISGFIFVADRAISTALEVIYQ